MKKRVILFDTLAMKLRLAVAAMLVALVILGCSWGPEGRTNPLDPLNPETGYDALELSLSYVEVAADSVSADIKIQLHWLDIDHIALDEYHVYRRVANDFQEWMTLIAVTQPGESSYIDPDSDPHERYYYRVTATFNEGSDSLSSESVLSTRLW